MKTELHKVKPYRTKDGSLIRELMHPKIHRNSTQSLAHATIEAGAVTHLHFHRESEELYHVTSGHCQLSLGDEIVSLEAGDTALITPGTPHRLYNPGPEPAEILCCCSPPYSHEDTVLVVDE